MGLEFEAGDWSVGEILEPPNYPFLTMYIGIFVLNEFRILSRPRW